MGITTSSRKISVIVVDWCIFPYHEIGILTGRPGGEGGKAMSTCEDQLVRKQGYDTPVLPTTLKLCK